MTQVKDWTERLTAEEREALHAADTYVDYDGRSDVETLSRTIATLRALVEELKAGLEDKCNWADSLKEPFRGLLTTTMVREVCALNEDALRSRLSQ